VGFTNHIWAVGDTGPTKWSWKVWTMLHTRCASTLRCLSEKQNYYLQCVC